MTVGWNANTDWILVPKPFRNITIMVKKIASTLKETVLFHLCHGPSYISGYQTVEW